MILSSALHVRALVKKGQLSLLSKEGPPRSLEEGAHGSTCFSFFPFVRKFHAIGMNLRYTPAEKKKINAKPDRFVFFFPRSLIAINKPAYCVVVMAACVSWVLDSSWICPSTLLCCDPCPPSLPFPLPCAGPSARYFFIVIDKSPPAAYITTPELEAIRGHSSAASLPTGPVMAEPFISPLGLTI